MISDSPVIKQEALDFLFKLLLLVLNGVAADLQFLRRVLKFFLDAVESRRSKLKKRVKTEGLQNCEIARNMAARAATSNEKLRRAIPSSSQIKVSLQKQTFASN